MTKVFISYSHDSQPHRDFVRGLSDRLRQDGLECEIDQYINGFPPEGWQRWMENQLEAADFVLLVCTEIYLRRYRGQETGGGKGANFEGLVISQHLYDAHYHNTKFVPVIPETGNFDHVPTPLKGFNTYTLNRDYDALYRFLTKQAEHIAPPVGVVRPMPASGNASSTPAPSAKPVASGQTHSINAERRERLQEKLRLLYKDYDFETRSDEKLRLKAIIESTQKELEALGSGFF